MTGRTLGLRKLSNGRTGRSRLLGRVVPVLSYASRKAGLCQWGLNILGHGGLLLVRSRGTRLLNCVSQNCKLILATVYVFMILRETAQFEPATGTCKQKGRV